MASSGSSCRWTSSRGFAPQADPPGVLGGPDGHLDALPPYRDGVYRFLLTRRWLSLLALVLALAVACVMLGSWQWHRREERLARNALVVENYDSPAVPLDSVLDDGTLRPESTWTPVTLSGEYVEAATVLVRNRPLEGQPGYEVLVPLVTDAGPTVLVDRGWVPTGRTGQDPDVVPAPPAGHVEAVVRVRPAEPMSDRDAPQGQTLSISPRALAPTVDAASAGAVDAATVVPGAYGVVASESPEPAQSLTRAPRPSLDEGPHLSYAMQWVAFALMGLVGFVVLARRAAEWDAQEAGHAAPAPARKPSRAGRRPSAEEEEDALVDAAERAATTLRPTRPPT